MFALSVMRMPSSSISIFLPSLSSMVMLPFALPSLKRRKWPLRDLTMRTSFFLSRWPRAACRSCSTARRAHRGSGCRRGRRRRAPRRRLRAGTTRRGRLPAIGVTMRVQSVSKSGSRQGSFSFTRPRPSGSSLRDTVAVATPATLPPASRRLSRSKARTELMRPASRSRTASGSRTCRSDEPSWSRSRSSRTWLPRPASAIVVSGSSSGKPKVSPSPFDEIVGALGELGGGALIGFVLRLHREAKLEHRLLAEGAPLDVAARNGAVLRPGRRRATPRIFFLRDLVPAVDLDLRDLVAEVDFGLEAQQVGAPLQRRDRRVVLAARPEMELVPALVGARVELPFLLAGWRSSGRACAGIRDRSAGWSRA